MQSYVNAPQTHRSDFSLESRLSYEVRGLHYSGALCATKFTASDKAKKGRESQFASSSAISCFICLNCLSWLTRRFSFLVLVSSQPACVFEKLAPISEDIRSHSCLPAVLVYPSVSVPALYSFTTFHMATVVTQYVFAQEGEAVIYADNARWSQSHSNSQRLINCPAYRLDSQQ